MLNAKINAVALNLHDQNTYDAYHHNQRERYTRFKHNLPYHVDTYITDNDKLNTNDYSLNNEFVEERQKRQMIYWHLHTLMVVLECVKIYYQKYI